MDINIHIDVNLNLDIHIITNVHIEDSIIYDLLFIYYLSPICYFLLAIPKNPCWLFPIDCSLFLVVSLFGYSLLNFV